MPSAHDDRDHKETRLLLAAAVALILLVAIVWGGIYYFVEYANFSDPFAAGLGLKNAALISFGVSLAVILVMAVVSGGDAIFGELPFTIAGFLIFFVIFWGRASGPAAGWMVPPRSAAPAVRRAADNICASSHSAPVPAGAPSRP